MRLQHDWESASKQTDILSEKDHFAWAERCSWFEHRILKCALIPTLEKAGDPQFMYLHKVAL